MIVGFIVYTLNQYEGSRYRCLLATLIILGISASHRQQDGLRSSHLLDWFPASKRRVCLACQCPGDQDDGLRADGPDVRAFAGLTTTARLSAGSPSAGNSANSTPSPPASSAARRAAAVSVPYGALIGALIMGQPGQRDVDARRRYLLADDRQGSILLLSPSGLTSFRAPAANADRRIDPPECFPRAASRARKAQQSRS